MRYLRKEGKLAPKSSSEIKSSRIGIGFEKLDRAIFEPEKAYDKLAKVGVKWVRIQSGWQRTETSPGKYDFGWLDSIVDNLLSRGMQPWICLCYGNPLYDDFAKDIFGAVGCPPIYTEEQKTAWANYCTAIASRYAAKVRYFEIWNEPDGLHCWKKGVSATEYGHFAISTALALRKGNPDAYVIGGSIFTSPVPFLREAFATGMGDHIDAVSFHEYTYTEENVSQKVKAIRGLCAFNGVSAEIIQGESGAQSRPDGHGAMAEGAWTPEIQAKQLLRHLTIDLLNGVKFTSFFTCVDMIEALNGKNGDISSYLDYGYFGILGADFNENGVSTGNYSPKPSYYALQNLCSLLSGNLRETDLPVIFRHEPAPHLGKNYTVPAYDMIYGGFTLDNGSHALAYWYPADLMTTVFTGAVTVECAMTGKIRLVDPMDGSIYVPENIHTDKFGTSVISNLPIRDYPLFLVFGNF